MIKKVVFTKYDNCSHNAWQEWDGREVKENYLYSMGEAYLKVSKHGRIWRINYRLGHDELTLPKFFSLAYTSQDMLRSGIEKFSNWALKYRRLLIEMQEGNE